MKLRWVGCGLLFLSIVLVAGGLLACGDKYFVTIQGTRYLRSSVTSDSNILIYNSPKSEISRLFASVSVEKILTRTGFVTTVVTNEDDFQIELAKQGWAIVMVGAADAQRLQAQMTADGRKALLPVVYNATRDQLKQLKDDKFSVLLKATTSQSEPFLDVIFDAYGHRPKPKVELARTGSH
jgi:hypothetical protein